jgi:drug/metabolite transporter (DMT)-like permease
MPPNPTRKTRILIAFACVYIFWGSTYGAIRIAGLHLAPPLVAATRSLISATIIAVICLIRGVSLRVPARTAWRLILVGILFMSVNNVFLTWAETKVPSGYASLVIAMIPIFVAVIESALPGGETLNLRGWLGTALGAVGMFALLWPSLHHSGTQAGRSLFGFGLLVVAALAFAIGSILARRFNFQTNTFVATAWQIGAAGIVNLSIAVVGNNFRTAEWTRSAVLAVVYLSVFGSIVGLTAYTYLLQNVPVTKVATYAFVNPIVAVLIGVVTLHERLSAAEIVGMVIIVLAVATVIVSRTKQVAENPVLLKGTGSPVP